MPRLVIDKLDKIFRSPGGQPVHAVKQFSLTVEDGQLAVLAGPSGCGKSTVLRIIAGLERAESGAVSLDGRTIDHLPPGKRDMAMVFQNPALYPHLTARENLAFGLKLRKFPRAEIEARVGQAVEMLGLGDCLERKPAEISGGQRQRVALGRALVRRPALFLFDEPLSSLDPALRTQMRLEIAQLHDRLGATMIYVTHDQTEAMTLADQLVVMRDGAIQQAAAPMAVYERPASRFVAGFIGSPPMNFLEGILRKKNGGVFFQMLSPAPSSREREESAESVPEYAGMVSPSVAERVSHHLDKPVIFGIRPEDVRMHQDEPKEDAMTATVTRIETTGAERYLHLKYASHPLLARARADCRMAAGEKVRVTFDLGKAHFFDPVSGQAV